jgi:hypothetical protein
MGYSPAVAAFGYAAADRLLRLRARAQRASSRRTGFQAVLRTERRRS